MQGSDQWQVVLRTLYALEAVLNQGMTQACGEVAVMFQSDPTPVWAATSHPHASVRQQAGKCIKLITGAWRGAGRLPSLFPFSAQRRDEPCCSVPRH